MKINEFANGRMAERMMAQIMSLKVAAGVHVCVQMGQ